MISRRTMVAIYLMSFVLVCDQLSKWVVVDLLTNRGDGLALTSFLNLVLVWNRGVTFGFFSHIPHSTMPWLLTGVAFIILVLLGRWLMRTSSTLVALSLGSIMGGAIGNVIDRLRWGAVVDFLDFYYQGHHWYAFNIADAAIVTGVTLLLADSLVRGR